MSGKSNYLEDKILGWAFKGQAMPTPPAAPFVGLFSGDPTDTGLGGSEVTTTIRTAGRVSGTFGSVTENTAGNTVTNTAVIDFGVAVGATPVTHFGIFDAASGGNLLYSAALTGGSQTINIGNQVSFAIGALVASEE